MKILFSFLCFASYSLSAQQNSKDIIKKMYQRYSGKWYHTFTFDQTTENYRNDSLIRTVTWYEAISYPDNFRIDFGDIKNGNGVIFKKDSAYNFRNGKLGKVSVNNNDLTFLLGGMYFYSFDSVISKLSSLGYDLNKFHEDKWQGRDAYVIGADNLNEKTNQLWIDKENLYVARFIKFENGRKEEGLLNDHKKFGGGWAETSCIFYIDDKLFQKENYHDCKADVIIDPKVFEPVLFGTAHWYQPK